MKRIFTLILVVTATILLVSCKETKVNKPVFYGVEDVEINLGTQFDPMNGVYVMDEIDGLITDTIEFSGEVNVNITGVYLITYKVTNSKKVSNVTNRNIKVVEVNDDTEIGGIINGDFSNGLNGWTTWNADSGYDVDYQAVDNKAVIDVITNSTDDQWWGVQLSFGSLKLQPSISYKLVFTVSSENERYMNFQINGDSTFGEKNLLLLTEEPKTIEKEFTSKVATENGKLEFALGNFTKGSYNDTIDETKGSITGRVFISDVKIIKGPKLENQAPVIVAPTTLVKLNGNYFIGQGIIVTDDYDTKVDYTIEDISDSPFVDTSVKGMYIFKITATDSEGLITVVEMKLYVAIAFEVPSLIDLNENGVPKGWEYWSEDTNGGMDVTFNNGVAELDITRAAAEGNVWENQFKTVNLAPVRGKYVLSFTAKADLPRPLIISMEGSGIDNLKQNFNLTKEFITYTFEFDVLTQALDINRSLQFWFGNVNNEFGYTLEDNVLTKVYLKDIKILERK